MSWLKKIESACTGLRFVDIGSQYDRWCAVGGTIAEPQHPVQPQGQFADPDDSLNADERTAKALLDIYDAFCSEEKVKSEKTTVSTSTQTDAHLLAVLHRSSDSACSAPAAHGKPPETELGLHTKHIPSAHDQQPQIKVETCDMDLLMNVEHIEKENMCAQVSAANSQAKSGRGSSTSEVALVAEVCNDGQYCNAKKRKHDPETCVHTRVVQNMIGHELQGSVEMVKESTARQLNAKQANEHKSQADRSKQQDKDRMSPKSPNKTTKHKTAKSQARESNQGLTETEHLILQSREQENGSHSDDETEDSSEKFDQLDVNSDFIKSEPQDCECLMDSSRDTQFPCGRCSFGEILEAVPVDIVMEDPGQETNNPSGIILHKQGRFPDLSAEELNQIEAASTKDALNTQRVIKQAVSVLATYAQARSLSLAEIEEMEEPSLDEFFAKMWAELRKADGSLYTKKTMMTMRYGLMRHFSMIRKVDIGDEDTFKSSNKMFKGMIARLKKEGKGIVKHKEAMALEDFQELYAYLDINSPQGLQDKVFVDVMVFFCNRGRESLREFSKDDLILATDLQGRNYFYISGHMGNKNCDNVEQSPKERMYEWPGSSMCPVQSLLKYKSKLNPLCQAFWQRPKTMEKVAAECGMCSSWYENAPIGKNTLGNKMKVLSVEAGLSKVYTNKCLQSTCIAALDDEGFFHATNLKKK